MDDPTKLYAAYLNYYQLTQRRRVVAKKQEHFLSVVFSIAVAVLAVLFSAQILNSWRFKADAKDLVGQLLLPTALAADLSATVEPYTTNLIMNAGQEATINLTFINNSQISWPAGQVSLETGPFLKTFSKVEHKSWQSFFKVTTLTKEIKPKEKISVSFKITGPEASIVGVIQENFQLVYNQQPIKGSLARVFIDANQSKPTFIQSSNNSTINTIKPTKTTANATTSTKAVEYITGYNKLGEKVQVIKGQYVPGISLTKPSDAAIATERARLAAIKSSSTSDQAFCIALSASERANQPQCQTNNSEAQTDPGIVEYSRKLAEEPLIRVGLFSSDQLQRITSDQPFDIYAANNLLVGSVPANTVVLVYYIRSTKQYGVIVNDNVYQTLNYLRFVSQANNDGVFQLPDYRNNPNWNANLNDNKFRRVMEYRYAVETDKIWWINELPIDSYLKGLAETSDASPLEFQKVLVTAARTYALYHYYRGLDFGLTEASTKHANEHFHVDATYDQVYRGYNSEIRMPRLAQAVQETRGMIVTYNHELAITPYFSRSDGRTRSWNEVWGGGEKPWLVSVPVPEEKGKTLFGHGVGMSAQGALLMVADEGRNWQDVLKYFYTGTSLERAY